MSRYYIARSNKKFIDDEDAWYSGIAIDDCAKHCDEQIGFECQSFDYCYFSIDWTSATRFYLTLKFYFGTVILTLPVEWSLPNA